MIHTNARAFDPTSTLSGVGVAVVAGHFEHLLHDRRRSIMVYNIIRRGACGYVFGRLDKLDGGENDGKTQ